MRGDRHVERQLPRTSSPHFESDAYYDGPEWDDARHGQPYANHHRSTTHHQHNHSNTSGRVGRLVSDQEPSRTTRGNPRSQFSRTRREDDQDTDDGSSSVVSYSSAGGYVPQSTKKIQNNNRTNYHEPTVRVHYVSQEETNPRFYSQHNNHLTHSDYLPSASRMPDIPERFRDEKDESEMYVTDSTFRKQRRPGPPGSIYRLDFVVQLLRSSGLTKCQEKPLLCWKQKQSSVGTVFCENENVKTGWSRGRNNGCSKSVLSKYQRGLLSHGPGQFGSNFGHTWVFNCFATL